MNKIYLVFPDSPGTIAPEIYGHFSEHIGGVFYDGLWVGKDSQIPNINGFRKSLIDDFKKTAPPVLRWPGGCFAETYDWRDGIGEDRPIRRNWWTSSDGRLESNEVGTHEFCDLCESLETKAYFAANVTSTTPMDIRDWMDYCLSPRGTTTLAKLREKNGHPEPFNIPYWGVGNENWGGGGSMTAETYANIFKRYAAVMRNAAPDVKLFACGPDSTDYLWTRQLCETLEASRRYMDGMNLLDGVSMHYYCGTTDGSPTDFNDDQWYEMLDKAAKMENILCRHYAILQAYDRQDAKLVIDEWGCWHRDGSGPSKGYNLFEQQSTMRDAMVSALTLNIFNNHCDKIQMANCAQLVNNLHCLFLAGGEKYTVTPTYHVFDMYKGHQGATAIRAVTEGMDGQDGLTMSASVKDGKVLVTIGNLSCSEDRQISLVPVGRTFSGAASAKLLAHENLCAHNTFDAPETVKPVNVKIPADGVITIPRGGILAVQADVI